MEPGFYIYGGYARGYIPIGIGFLPSIIENCDCSFLICAEVALLNDLPGVLWKCDDKILIGNLFVAAFTLEI